jgi:hypothetical protein
MDKDTTSENTWVDQHQPDPRFPTNPDYVELEALSEQYGIEQS